MLKEETTTTKHNGSTDAHYTKTGESTCDGSEKALIEKGPPEIDEFRDECDEHPKQALDFFCEAHTCMCCAMCGSEGNRHHGCEIKPLYQYAEKIHRFMPKLTKKLRNNVKASKIISEDILKSKNEETLKQVQAVKDKIAEEFRKLRQALDEREKELVNAAESLWEKYNCSGTMKELSDIREREEAIKRVEQAERSWDKDNPKKMVHAMCKGFEAYQNSSSILSKAIASAEDKHTIDFTFNESLLKGIKIFGEVKSETESLGPKLALGKVTSDSVNLTWSVGCFVGGFYSLFMMDNNNPQNKSEVYKGRELGFTVNGLSPKSDYTFWVRANVGGSGNWSEPLPVKTLKKELPWSTWKKCSEGIPNSMKYITTPERPGFAEKAYPGPEYSTVIGVKPVPKRATFGWKIKIDKSYNNDGNGIFIGVAPSDIDQCVNKNYSKAGWYLHCYDSSLWSGPPHNHRGKEYGPNKQLKNGDAVGVVMDTAKGELSFVVDNANLGVAFDGIPLDKPLVPCVLLYWYCDSVELTI